ncbi:hypothetical protein [Pirellulimonas nuda]|nr:hypothetical protein [Pirellulimonas nuda]
MFSLPAVETPVLRPSLTQLRARLLRMILENERIRANDQARIHSTGLRA